MSFLLLGTVLTVMPLTLLLKVQAGGTWANSSGLGWAISSMGLSRPAAQGVMSSAASGSALVPPGPAPAAAPAASIASAPQAMHLRHDDGPPELSGQQAFRSSAVPLLEINLLSNHKIDSACLSLVKTLLNKLVKGEHACLCHTWIMRPYVPHRSW